MTKEAKDHIKNLQNPYAYCDADTSQVVSRPRIPPRTLERHVVTHKEKMLKLRELLGEYRSAIVDTYCDAWNPRGNYGAQAEEKEEESRGAIIHFVVSLIGGAKPHDSVRTELEAIKARITGEFDNPSLKKFGPLLTDHDADILRFVESALAKL